ITTLAPSTSGGLRLSNRVRAQVTGIEMSPAESRIVMNTVPSPGRRLIWAICPSTHTGPSRSTQLEIARAICRTGAGAAGEVSRAMAASVGHPSDAVGRVRGFGWLTFVHLDSGP